MRLLINCKLCGCEVESDDVKVRKGHSFCCTDHQKKYNWLVNKIRNDTFVEVFRLSSDMIIVYERLKNEIQ